MGVFILNRKERRNAQFGNSDFYCLEEAYKSLQPSPRSVRGYDNTTFLFYQDLLYRKIKGNFEIVAPKEWDIGYILEGLILNGVICVTDSKVGVVPLKSGLSGINVFDRPTDCNIANSVLGSFSRKIDVDCVALKIDDRYNSLRNLINRFAQRLAMCDASIDVNLLNTRVAMVFDCADSKQVETAKSVYDKISQGEPAVFLRSGANPLNSELSVMFANVKNTYIANDVQCEKRTIMEEFLTEIGINNCNVDKQARLNEAEVNSNNDELNINTDMWRRNLEIGSKQVREMYGVDFSITYKKPTVSLVNESEESEDNKDDDVE